MKNMMIDYRDEEGNFKRKIIDNYELCIHDNAAYFISEGAKTIVQIQDIIQIYTY